LLKENYDSLSRTFTQKISLGLVVKTPPKITPHFIIVVCNLEDALNLHEVLQPDLLKIALRTTANGRQESSK
jgi:hypothetical protein